MIEDDQELRAMMEKISKTIGESYAQGNRFFAGCPEGGVFFYFATGKETNAQDVGARIPAQEKRIF